MAVDSIGLNKFINTFQLTNEDRVLYVTGKITSLSNGYNNEGTLYIKDNFGEISIRINHSNIQYLIDYWKNCIISLDDKEKALFVPNNDLSKLNKKLDKDIENFIVAVPLLIFAKNRQEKDFYDLEVGKNGNFYAASGLRIRL